MKTNQKQNKIGGAVLVFSLMFGIAVVLSTTAQAQNPDGRYSQNRDGNWERYGNYGGTAQLRQTALNVGYEEGIKEGRKMRAQRARADYRQQNTYQKATKGYNSRLGDRELYRRYFREGFASGFNAERYNQDSRDRDDRYSDRNDNGNQERRGRNWDRYGNFGGSSQLRQTALNAGFNNGIEEGRKDRRQNEGFNFRDESDYQKATEDYSSRLGSRELYIRYFREGFENGYESGFNGY